MARNILQQIRQAIENLNPSEVRKTAEQPILIGLVASSEVEFEEMENYFCPESLSQAKQRECRGALVRMTHPNGAVHLTVFAHGAPGTADVSPAHGVFEFNRDFPERMINEILDDKEELGLPLARYFPAFREVVTDRVVKAVSKENTLFSLATALPNIVPSFISLPWAAAEFSSDTAFLTVNQVRMAFLLGAASDQRVGYREQRAEIASIIAGAFGWRALARQLVGKVPAGVGLIPKAAVAYAGTYVVGKSLERFYRIGRMYTRAERREAYEEAFERGKQVAAALLERLRSPEPRRAEGIR